MRHTAYIPRERKGFGVLLPAETAGIAVGAVYAACAGMPEKLGDIIFPATLMDVFTGTLTLLAAVLAAAFLSGLFAFGQVSAVGLIAAVGAFFGGSAALIYAERGLAAFPVVTALLLPKALAVSAVSLLAARETFRSSSAILRCLTGKEPDSRGLRLYCVRFAVLLFISLIISAADTLLNYVFAGLV